MRRAYTDRMMLSEAIDAAGAMIQGYPNGGANAGKSYIGIIAALLCSYPRGIAIACADPLRGVARETRFLPTVADIVAWCEPRVAALHTSVARDERIEQQLRERREREEKYGTLPAPTFTRANILVPTNVPIYADLVEKSKTADPSEFRYASNGIWVAESWFVKPRCQPI